ncbi:uncharacterized protein LOC121371814 [Gigantopelta aegis]|uniref:uncharacterized protein LOC121371814 n=1 Tax=Gigantopelta aegis TaxID=1735272 RepID=UPI001B88864D|nr:uncharacterized protein LOC121371814 [Gigantopelta aegis]
MEEPHHVKRSVRMDYSLTYRGNEELDDILETQLGTLHQEQHKVERNKCQEIEEARREAEQFETLKEIINNRSVDAVDLYNSFCKQSTSGDDNEQGPYRSKEVSKTLKRIQKERDKFSAKNLFNVTIPRLRRSSSVFQASVDGENWTGRRAASATVQSSAPAAEPKTQRVNHSTDYTPHSPVLSHVPGPRPVSVPARCLRSESSSGRYSGSAGLARSRKQLREMSELEQFYSRPPVMTAWEVRQHLLYSLMEDNKRLQTRVNSFVEELRNFNKRQKQPKYYT